MRNRNRKGREPGNGRVLAREKGRATMVCDGPRREAAETTLDANGENATLVLPGERFRLEEANLPAKLAASLAGRRVGVLILPEEEARTRQVRLERNTSVWRDTEGNYWNDYQPVRITFACPDGTQWRLPGG
ncbi:MAG: hypothetical protein KGM47_17365 [Acidobacteriota bacterium]|nr:hypothetical protein [Acidobacteriota bacterium]